MQTERSARVTCGAARSAVECTVTVSMPRSRAARTMRSAISPRLATSRRRGAGITQRTTLSRSPGRCDADLLTGRASPQSLHQLGQRRAAAHRLGLALPGAAQARQLGLGVERGQQQVVVGVERTAVAAQVRQRGCDQLTGAPVERLGAWRCRREHPVGDHRGRPRSASRP